MQQSCMIRAGYAAGLGSGLGRLWCKQGGPCSSVLHLAWQCRRAAKAEARVPGPVCGAGAGGRSKRAPSLSQGLHTRTSMLDIKQAHTARPRLVHLMRAQGEQARRLTAQQAGVGGRASKQGVSGTTLVATGREGLLPGLGRRAARGPACVRRGACTQCCVCMWGSAQSALRAQGVAHACMRPVHTAAKVMGLLATPKPMHALSHAVARSDACLRARMAGGVHAWVCMRAPSCPCVHTHSSSGLHNQASAAAHPVCVLACPPPPYLRALVSTRVCSASTAAHTHPGSTPGMHAGDGTRAPHCTLTWR